MSALTSEPEASNAADGVVLRAETAWKVLIVDRDDGFRALCRSALDGVTFKGQNVALLFADTPAEAEETLAEQPGIVLILIAAAPDRYDTALGLVTHIRDGLRNRLLRIVLCTEQPDGAFERSAVMRHDINEFRTRAELADGRLCAVVVEALRGYSSALSLENNYKMMVATAGLFSLRSRSMFYFNMLLQLDAMLDGGRNSLICVSDLDSDTPEPIVRAASGRYLSARNHPLDRIGDPKVIDAIRRTAENGETLYTPDLCLFRMRPRGDVLVVVYADISGEGTPIDRKLIDVFRDKAQTALLNLLLAEELKAAEEATVRAFASLADHSDQFDTGHVGRFERMAAATAGKMLELQFHPQEVDRYLVEQIGLASTLHDIGLYRIPESILENVDELMEDDYQLIHLHPKIGHDILAIAATPLRGRSLLSIAAEIALGHHERYDGSGYPNRVKGDAVPVSARIAGVVDVFDALVTDRVRRRATPAPDALRWLESRAGKEFDPKVVEAFVLAIGDILKNQPDFFSTPKSPSSDPGLGSRIAAIATRLFRKTSDDTMDANLDTHR